MAIVTLLTDSGESDHYAAAIKAKILGVNPATKIVDISHKIPPCDIAHGAFVLKSVFRIFRPVPCTWSVLTLPATGGMCSLPYRSRTTSSLA